MEAVVHESMQFLPQSEKNENIPTTSSPASCQMCNSWTPMTSGTYDKSLLLSLSNCRLAGTVCIKINKHSFSSGTDVFSIKTTTTRLRAGSTYAVQPPFAYMTTNADVMTTKITNICCRICRKTAWIFSWYDKFACTTTFCSSNATSSSVASERWHIRNYKKKKKL